MIDPRRFVLLIRHKESGIWEDKTRDFTRAHRTDTGSVHVVSEKNGRHKEYTYGEGRAVLSSGPRRIPFEPGMGLFVKGEWWDKPGAEILEFDGPDHLRRRIVYASRDGELKAPTYPADQVVVMPNAADRPGAGRVLDYWRQILSSMPSDDPTVLAYEGLRFVHPDSALADFLGDEPLHEPQPVEPAVFPFASNISQRSAVDKALQNRVSVINGPPGTGKTETILNLIAAIVTQGLGSVGVVSFSNAAVDNVRDKLTDAGFGFLIAALGNREKRDDFFTEDHQQQRIDERKRFIGTAPQAAPDGAQLSKLTRDLLEAQEVEQKAAETRAELAQFELERQHFDLHLSEGEVPDLERLPLLRRSPKRILEFLVESHLADRTGQPGLLGRLRRYFRYGNLRGLDPGDTGTVLRLQAAFYDRRIDELRQKLAGLERKLAGKNIETLASSHRDASKTAFAFAVAQRARASGHDLYSGSGYKDKFDAFRTDYPVVLSTCHSLRRCLPDGYLLDYLIVDEASQVDLLSGGLALASCRNIVIVGDEKQLPQISAAVPAGVLPPAGTYDYTTKSLLSSVKSRYGDQISTMLRGHYRCHPAIIGFCNTAFYDDKLVVHTTSAGRPDKAMWVHPTSQGNHERRVRNGGRYNRREIDVIKEEVMPDITARVELADIAVATPFRLQVTRTDEALDGMVDVDTVHKLQGRQKPVVVMTTVISENKVGRQALKFVDNAHLVNVAVSRAIDQFILVTNHGRLRDTRNLRNLIGYIAYQNPGEDFPTSDVVSIFDLLYQEYSERLQAMAARLRPDAKYKSEEAARVLLTDLLADAAYAHLRFETQVLTRNLVPDPASLDLSERQRTFLRSTSSVDFVIYNRITNAAVLPIEVDGFKFHEDNPAQLERDAVKDSILTPLGLEPVRLKTNDSGEEQKIRARLAQAGEGPPSTS